MREDDDNNINDDEDMALLESNDSVDHKLYIKNILEENENDYLNDEKDKEIFDNSMKLSIKKFFNRKTHSQCYEQNFSFEQVTKKIIKLNTTKLKLIFMKFIFLPLVVICDLSVIFQFIKIYNTIFKIGWNSIKFKINFSDKDPKEIEKFSIEDVNKNYNFYVMFFEETQKNIFDFGLIFPTSIIGTFLLKKIGFRFSSIILHLLNLVAILLIIKIFPFLEYYNFNNTYPTLYIPILGIIWLLLFLGVGGSAMLSLQLIMDKIDKCNEYYSKLIKEEKNNIIEEQKNRKNQESQIREESDGAPINLEFPLCQENESERINNKKEENDEILNIKKEKIYKNLIFLFIIISIAYIPPFFTNNLFLIKLQENNVEYMAIAGCDKNYNCFQSVMKDRKLSLTNKKLFNKLKLRIYEDSRYYFIYICIICFAKIIVYMIIYTIINLSFTKVNSNKNKNGIETKKKYMNF